MSWSNDKHPELQDGEVFLTNIDKDTTYPREDYFKRIGFVTKRKGVVAYDRSGNVIKECVPVFVARAELDKYNKV